MGFRFPGGGFVRLSRSAGGLGPGGIARVSSAIIGGDFSGNARGAHSLDFQMARDVVTDVASGDHSIAFGSDSEASGNQAIAIGLGNKASALSAVAVGANVTASGQEALAVGVDGSAAGKWAVTLGFSPDAAGADAVAIGTDAQAAFARSIAIGKDATPLAVDEACIAATVLRLKNAANYWRVMLEGDTAGGELNGTYPNPTLRADKILERLLTVDGAGSGLDADLLDGLSSVDFALAGAAGPVDRVVATGETYTIPDGSSLVVAGYWAVQGTGVLAIEGDGALAII